MKLRIFLIILKFRHRFADAQIWVASLLCVAWLFFCFLFFLKRICICIAGTSSTDSYSERLEARERGSQRGRREVLCALVPVSEL